MFFKAKPKNILSVCFTSVFLARAISLAAETNTTSIAVPNASAHHAQSVTRVESENINSFNTSRMSFQIQNMSYQSANQKGNNSEQNFEFQYLFMADKEKNASVHIIFGGYPSSDFNYIAMPVAYFSKAWSTQLNQKTYFGRKIESQNFLDSYFNLGLVQPTFTQDNVRFTQQGLTGFHHHVEGNRWGFRLSYLPVYLPNQGPSVKEQDGEIVGANRWAQRPPSKFAFNDNNNEIVYVVEGYNLSEIVFNQGVFSALNMSPLKNVDVVVSYSRAPINEVVLSRDTYANLDMVGQVKLAPVVVYTQTAAADVQWRVQNWTASASYIQDRPENKKAAENRAIQNLEPISGYGVGLEYDFSDAVHRQFKAHVGYAQFRGGEILDTNADGSANIFTFTKQRLQFENPFRVGAEGEVVRLNSRPVTTKVEWTYDRTQRGSMLTTEVKYEPIKSLHVNLGVDVLGSDLAADDESSYFLQQYQANDRVFGGLEYVF